MTAYRTTSRHGQDARSNAYCSTASMRWQPLAARTGAGAFAHVARRLTKRGVVAAISDFYCEPAAFGRALTMLGARGHDPDRLPSAGRL